MELVRYDAACRALAEAKQIDEAMEVKNIAEAMRAYARQAKNKNLEADAMAIRVRAERRLGQMIKAQSEAGMLNSGGRPSEKPDSKTNPVTRAPTLKEVGLDKSMANVCRKMAAIPDEEFESMISDFREKIEKESRRVTLNLLRAGEKAEARADKEKALADKIRDLPDAQFGVILADPPWRFSVRSDKGLDRAADNHYPTQTTEDICNLDVPSVSADDCVLFLWATVPMLPDALAVMAEWGFEYKSHVIWAKDRMGTGYWFRNRHELLLVGTKGNVVPPEMGTQWPSVVDAPVAEHSAKPDIFYDLVEDYYPNIPKLEMNARGSGRPGWAVWGLEAEAA